jgi:DNA-binding NarL/FixJ family response regulator
MEQHLTKREEQVIVLVARGLANKAIAGELGISPDRVKTIVHQICVKLGAENRTDAGVKWARRQ